MKFFVSALILLGLISSAEARQRHTTKTSGLDAMCNITMPCIAPMTNVAEAQRVARGKYVAREVGIGGVAPASLRDVLRRFQR